MQSVCRLAVVTGPTARAVVKVLGMRKCFPTDRLAYALGRCCARTWLTGALALCGQSLQLIRGRPSAQVQQGQRQVSGGE